MKKPYKNNEFSQARKCGSCKKPLKMNLLHKIPKAEFCYRCFYPLEMLRRGIRVTSAGASLVGYIIIIAGVTAAIIMIYSLGVSLFGGAVKSLFDSIANIVLIP